MEGELSKTKPPFAAMDAPPSTAATTITTYPDSIDSSPRSRNTDSWPDDLLPPPTTSTKLRLMCSYGGHIVPRPHDKSLFYAGGDTRIVVVDRSSSLSDLLSRLSKTLLQGRPFTLKYQLPNEDLDSLITVSSDEDLENMIDEYERLQSCSKPSRIRLFLFPVKPEVLPSSNSIGSILDGSNRAEDWFLNALNGASSAALQRGFSDPVVGGVGSVDCLLELDEHADRTAGNKNNSANSDCSNQKEGEDVGGDGKKLESLGNQDVHSVPDSPIIGTTSSFGSASSSPLLANLPPIRVHVEEGVGGVRVSEQRGGGLGGVEEQFAQMGLGVQQRQEEGLVGLSSAPTVLPNVGMAVAGAVVTGMPVTVGGGGGGGGEYLNRVFSDDERSDHGIPLGYRKPVQTQPLKNSQAQQMQQLGDLPSPDSVSSDTSLSNAFSRQKPVMYQEQVSQVPPAGNRVPPNLVDLIHPNTRVQLQQLSDDGYAFPAQYDQHQQQLLQLQQQHPPSQPQPQLIHAGAHFVHHHPAGAVPITSYYPMYPSQHPQLDQRYPVYYVSSGQAQAYNLPLQQQQPSKNMVDTANSLSSNQPQALPNPTMLTRNMPPSNPEMAAGLYRTAAATSPQPFQVSPGQHQSQPQQRQQQQHFMGYSQIHHPSQPMAPTSAATATYAYEYADPAHAQIYYTQPLAPALASQYQAMTSASGVALPDATALLPVDNVKQQIRTSQPL